MLENPFSILERRFNRIESLLIEIKEGQPTQIAITNGKPLSIEDVAKLTNLKKATIYKLVHNKEIPYYKPAGSKKLNFFESDIIDWLKSGRKKTNYELANDARNFLRKGPKKKGAK